MTSPYTSQETSLYNYSKNNESNRTLDASVHPPEHLLEFLSFMNKPPTPLSPQTSSVNYHLPESKNKRVTRQPSLNTFTSFTPSVLDLPNILTSKDFEVAIGTYQTALDKAEKFRAALVQVSEAASEFGQALEDTINLNPKVNNTKHVSDGLINAGSLQYIVGSNHQILSRLLQDNFQDPMKVELQKLEDTYKTNHDYYQQEVKLKSKALRLKELENIKLLKLKTRNLSVYKNNLINLTSQLDEIDRLKYDYYLEMNAMLEGFNQHQLLTRTGSIIRAELELFEGIARKGWSGGGLDKLLEIAPDLFAIDYDQDYEETGIDTIEEDFTVKDTGPQDANDDSISEPGIESDLIQETSSIQEPAIKNLQDLDLDESFSLPKVNGSFGKNSDTDYTHQDILGDVTDS